MSGPPGPGPQRAMSVGTNGPPSAGLAPHGGMAGQQGAPPPQSATGAGAPQSQQNLNQIVSSFYLFVLGVAVWTGGGCGSGGRIAE